MNLSYRVLKIARAKLFGPIGGEERGKIRMKLACHVNMHGTTAWKHGKTTRTIKYRNEWRPAVAYCSQRKHFDSAGEEENYWPQRVGVHWKRIYARATRRRPLIPTLFAFSKAGYHPVSIVAVEHLSRHAYFPRGNGARVSRSVCVCNRMEVLMNFWLKGTLFCLSKMWLPGMVFVLESLM